MRNFLTSPENLSLESACKLDQNFPNYKPTLFTNAFSVDHMQEKSRYLAYYLTAMLKRQIGDQIEFIATRYESPASVSITFNKPLDLRCLLHWVDLVGSHIEMQSEDSLKITLNHRTKFSAVYFTGQQFKAALEKKSVTEPLLTDLFPETMLARPKL